MKYLKTYEENNIEDKLINDILSNFPEKSDDRKLPKNFFKAGDFAMGNLHISKDMSGGFLKQTKAKNNSICLIIRVIPLKTKEHFYKVKFLNKIPDDNDFPLNILNKNNQQQNLSGRYLKIPTKNDFLNFLNNKKEKLNKKEYINFLKNIENELIKLKASEYNL